MYETLGKILEMAMLICFGISWPFSIINSLKAKTAKGKSPVFLSALLLGYIIGVIMKFVRGLDYVTVFYSINLIMVFTDLMLWLRNRRLDKER